MSAYVSLPRFSWQVSDWSSLDMHMRGGEGGGGRLPDQSRAYTRLHSSPSIRPPPPSSHNQNAFATEDQWGAKSIMSCLSFCILMLCCLILLTLNKNPTGICWGNTVHDKDTVPLITIPDCMSETWLILNWSLHCPSQRRKWIQMISEALIAPTDTAESIDWSVRLEEMWLNYLDMAEEAINHCNQIPEEEGGQKPGRLPKVCSKTWWQQALRFQSAHYRAY